MGKYQPETERGSVYVIRDTETGELVTHAVLLVPERFRSARRAWRRIAQLEAHNA